MLYHQKRGEKRNNLLFPRDKNTSKLHTNAASYITIYKSSNFFQFRPISVPNVHFLQNLGTETVTYTPFSVLIVLFSKFYKNHHVFNSICVCKGADFW